MKALSVTFLAIFIGSFSIAAPNIDKGKKNAVKKAYSLSKKSKSDKKEDGRQCCTKSTIDESTGSIISITACAGWFLSNDASALTRACEKADQALRSL